MNFAGFLRIAKGSAGEVENQLYIAEQVGYISSEDLDATVRKLEKLSKQIGAFIAYLEKYKATRNPKLATN